LGIFIAWPPKVIF